MRRDRVEAELPPAVVAWLRDFGTKATWDAIARDVAEAVGRELVADDGSRGWDRTARARIRSGAAVSIAANLRRGIWTANLVAPVVAGYFELFSATDDLRRRLTRPPSRLAETVPTPPPEPGAI